MHITFIGQLGLPAGLQDATEQRVQGLAGVLAANGAKVTVLCATPYTPRNLRRLKGIELHHIPSFDPRRSGGWLYTFLSVLALWRLQPDVVHMEGWKAGVFVRLAALFLPETTFVWTLADLPTGHLLGWKLVTVQAKSVFDAIVANTREVQYHMLTTFGVRSVYIPQGYEEDVLADIPAAYWGLRRGQYSLSFLDLDNAKEAKSLIMAYTATKTRKKLVIAVTEWAPWQAKLEKKYPLAVFLPVTSDRPLHSLIHQAAMVVLYQKGLAARTVLQAMAAGSPIVAINYPAYQELLGTTAQFLREGDSEGLTKAMTDIVFYRTRQEAWGKKAALRAKSHFTLGRIAEEYETLYHYPLVKRVGVDSLQARRLAVN